MHGLQKQMQTDGVYIWLCLFKKNSLTGDERFTVEMSAMKKRKRNVYVLFFYVLFLQLLTLEE